MMGRPFDLLRDSRASAAAEMAMVTPLLLALLFGSVEVGNYYLNQHVVSKAVRDGARFASRMTLANPYGCTAGDAASSGVFEDPDAEEKILNVTKRGSVDTSGAGRFQDAVWDKSCTGAAGVQVTVRCVPEGTYAGIYTDLDGDVPVVKVSADIEYPSVLDALGFNTSGVCLRAESEAAVAGL